MHISSTGSSQPSTSLNASTYYLKCGSGIEAASLCFTDTRICQEELSKEI